MGNRLIECYGNGRSARRVGASGFETTGVEPTEGLPKAVSNPNMRKNCRL